MDLFIYFYFRILIEKAVLSQEVFRNVVELPGMESDVNLIGDGFYQLMIIIIYLSSDLHLVELITQSLIHGFRHVQNSNLEPSLGRMLGNQSSLVI